MKKHKSILLKELKFSEFVFHNYIVSSEIKLYSETSQILLFPNCLLDLENFIKASLCITNGVFLSENEIAIDQNFLEIQNIIEDEKFIFIPTRYKKIFDTNTLKARQIYSAICNVL